jgi:hypothetical protein
MRLWSLHPKYLDSKGLVALWREGLLARKVLAGQTKGYTQHPQLERFKSTSNPVASMDTYLHEVVHEATSRGYHFDATKLGPIQKTKKLSVTDGQLLHERDHLARKLQLRAPHLLDSLPASPEPHPLFDPTNGAIESWERP